jgi:hypothetical protein
MCAQPTGIDEQNISGGTRPHFHALAMYTSPTTIFSLALQSKLSEFGKPRNSLVHVCQWPIALVGTHRSDMLEREVKQKSSHSGADRRL